jgi:hypothetical protein
MPPMFKFKNADDPIRRKAQIKPHHCPENMTQINTFNLKIEQKG